MKKLAALLTLLAVTDLTHAASPRSCRVTTSRVNKLRVDSTAHSIHHQAAHQQFVITAFAIPVAVPVAPFAPYWYGINDYYHGPLHGSASVRGDLENRRRETASDKEPRAAELRFGGLRSEHSLVAQRCTSCHGRTSPKEGLSLIDPPSLSAGDRLRAIRAVIHGEMPPETEPPLTDADRTALLRELTAD